MRSTTCSARGLSEATIRRFGLGWSGPGRGALAADLAREGVDPTLMEAAGLLRPDPDGGRAREMFYERLMFPIRDRAGRPISFGGRILGDGQPKYLNGPETALFSKRHGLYGLDLARAARDRRVVVVEGYMDVIALHQAGFAGAVAPLGTALTEEQLAELWRLSPLPVLSFDGDPAGRRAAMRAANLALPLLGPDRSLAFAALPEGEDPDSLMRRQGPAALGAVLDKARPLVEMLFDWLRESAGGSGPEQRAALRARIDDAARRIPDRALSAEYRRALLDRFFAERRSRNGGRPKPVPPRPAISETATRAERGRILTAALLAHPGLLRDVEHAFTEVALPADCARLRAALLDWAEQADVLDSAGLTNHLTISGLMAEAKQIRALAPAFARADAMPSEAEAGWWHIFGLMNLPRLLEERAAAQQAAGADMNAATQHRLIALNLALDRVTAAEPEDPGF